jgi:hypothetical protein
MAPNPYESPEIPKESTKPNAVERQLGLTLGEWVTVVIVVVILIVLLLPAVNSKGRGPKRPASPKADAIKVTSSEQ